MAGEGSKNAATARHVKKAHRRKHAGLLVSAAPVKSDINITPLVDVVLVLLIIFMVVTPMLSRGVKVDLPETVNHAKKQDTGEQVVVTVQSTGKVFIEDEEITNLEDLPGRMKVAMKKHPGGEIHVKGDKKLEYGVVRKVLERIHEAGPPSVALGSEERKKEGQ